MKRAIAIVLAMATAVSILSGCGRAAVSSDESGQSTVSSAAVSGETPAGTETADSPDSSETSAASPSTGKTSSGNTAKPTLPTAPPVGNTSFDFDKVNLKGVTLKKLVWYTVGESEKSMNKDFEKKYGCTIQNIYTEYNNIQNKLIASIASNDSIDIGPLYGSYFPGIVIQNIYQPIEKYISKSSLYNPSNLAAGGFDLDKMNYFSWGGHYYGFSSYYQVLTAVCIFNKKMLRDGGYSETEPLDLIAKNKWNWDSMYDIAKNLTEPNVQYGLDTNLVNTYWITSAGAQLVKYDKGTPVHNLDDPRVKDGLNMLKKIFLGNTAVADTDFKFKDGKAALYIGQMTDIINIVGSSVSSVRSNWDVCAAPMSAGSKTTKNASYWLSGIAITKGSKHPDGVAAYAYFTSKYPDSPDAWSLYSKEQQNRLSPLYRNALYPNHGYGNMNSLVTEMIKQVAVSDADPAAVINANKPLFTAEITNTLKKQ